MKKLLLLISLLLATNTWGENEYSYSDFLSLVESNQVLSVEFQNDNYTIKGKTVNGENFKTEKPPFLQDDLSEKLRDHMVSVIAEKPEQESIFKQLLLGISGLFAGLFFVLIPIVIATIVVFYTWRFLKNRDARNKDSKP